MKKMFIFFISFFVLILFFPLKSKLTSFAFENQYEYTFLYNKKTFKFSDLDFEINLTQLQKKNYHNVKLIENLKYIGISKEEIINYLFPEIKCIFLKLSNLININEQQGSIVVLKNKCEIKIFNGKEGVCIDKINFYNDIFNQITNNKKIIKINLKTIKYKSYKDLNESFKEKSCFSTNFSTSSKERKNNIKVAMSKFDGYILEDGEIFSFNEITGERNEKSGYKQAKIISGGTFVSGFGGGVCQVSTTIYNAALLAGLEIIEVNSHSLPVSYIEPSFDAMVNTGSSDLKFRNNTGGKIIITTSTENDCCKVKIFGLKNQYKITRQSEKIDIIKSEPDIIDYDYLKYNISDLEVGEEKRISYAKDGFTSRGYLNFYNEYGELVKNEKIRDNKYNDTKGIIVRREK